MHSIHLTPIVNLSKELQRLERLYFEDGDEVLSINFEGYFKNTDIYYTVLKEDSVCIYDVLLSSATLKREETDKLCYAQIDDCEMLFFDSVDMLFVFTDKFNKPDVENLLTTLL